MVEKRCKFAAFCREDRLCAKLSNLRGFVIYCEGLASDRDACPEWRKE
jgi:hypothetical protein